MARPKKATVDYFPHLTEHGKTMFILESKWGNDGYAAWFKILEKLGSSDGHYIDCREETAYVFLAAYIRVPEETLTEILNSLAYLNAIDRDLWRRKVIFCQHFVDGVKDAYRKRLDNFPTREKVFTALSMSISEFTAEETPLQRVSGAGSTERERERERKAIASKKPTRTPSGENQIFISWWTMAYEKVMGQPYLFTGKDAKHVLMILKALGRQQAMARAISFFLSEDPFYTGKKDLGMFLSQINKLQAPDWPAHNEHLRELGIVPPAGVKFEDWKFWEV